MIAYKFLRAGAVGPFSGFAWPADGEWVEAGAPLDPCRAGVHGFQADAIAEWLDDELWRVELAGSRVDLDGVVMAERGRLVARVEAWDEGEAARFAETCAERLRGRAAGDERFAAYAETATAVVGAGATADPRFAALVGFIARHAAEDVEPGGWASELAWQSRLLAERVGL